jgi:hypothetical protein
MSIVRELRVAAGLGIVTALAIAACGGTTAGHGTLSGHLYATGGPASPGGGSSPHPISGTVVARGPGGTHRATVTANGRYTLRLPPGRYTVTGKSPQYVVNGNPGPCDALGAVTVARDQVRFSDVYCVP